MSQTKFRCDGMILAKLRDTGVDEGQGRQVEDVSQWKKGYEHPSFSGWIQLSVLRDL